MGTENAKCRALLELLQGRQVIEAVNIQRLFGWGNSRTLRLLASLQDGGLIAPDSGRPGQYIVQGGSVAQGLPTSVVAQVCDVLGNGEFLPIGKGAQ
ncbi:hypothetical protein [Aeromonas hydrophila]|uniref:hypothetical protein n=1 Tax=Aeromonas hydrophila TaxID=644 RepID=UPI00080AB3AC|nr:hypothetical protein [Aeromonas hydrophila]ANT70202.1 hypothetical protein TK34_22255 [Aeromonas hydrophila]